MTVIDRPTEVHVEEATIEDLRAARDRALAEANITLDELRAEAATGHFSTLDRRLAWIVARAIEEA